MSQKFIIPKIEDDSYCSISVKYHESDDDFFICYKAHVNVGM